MTELIGRMLLFVPRVMVSMVMLVIRRLFRALRRRGSDDLLRNLGMGEARLLGRLAVYAIMVFVVMIALDQLGLGDVIRQTFLIIVAAVALGLALAFGLGGRERAQRRLIDRWSARVRGRRGGAATKRCLTAAATCAERGDPALRSDVAPHGRS